MTIDTNEVRKKYVRKPAELLLTPRVYFFNLMLLNFEVGIHIPHLSALADIFPLVKGEDKL